VNKGGDWLTYGVIGKAMQVHRELGPGVDECFYHQRLSELLREAGLEHQYKPRESLRHHGIVVDVFEPDIVVPEHLILELKRLHGGFAPANFLQLKAYLKLWRIRHGLLFDFGKESLVQQRYIYDDPPAPILDVTHSVTDAPALVRDSVIAPRIAEAAARIAVQFGLGFADTTYRRLLGVELQADGLAVITDPRTTVRARNRVLGQTQLPCLAVGGSWAVMVLSQRDNIRPADRAILRSWLRHLCRPCGTVLHFGKHEVQIQWVLDSNRGSDVSLAARTD
jgi:GxxExxY protein